MEHAAMKDHPDLTALIKTAVKAYNKLTPAEKKEMRRLQRISWVYGNLAVENPNITREMVEKAAEEWP